MWHKSLYKLLRNNNVTYNKKNVQTCIRKKDKKEEVKLQFEIVERKTAIAITRKKDYIFTTRQLTENKNQITIIAFQGLKDI